jgi:DNA repair protein RadC
VAALSSSKVSSLIERFFSLNARNPSLQRSTGASPDATVHALRTGQVLSGDEIDDLWLQRIELRSLKRVKGYLEHTCFRKRNGTITALFVDRRCGLIAEEIIGSAWSLRQPDAVVRHILRLASRFHAHGLILATNDPQATTARRNRYREMTMQLQRKGEIIDVFLLNHLVLAADQWTSVSANIEEGQSRCAS